MAKSLDFNQLFPEASDGSRGPLPKQLQFFNMAVAPATPANPKFIAYVGGIGSGKTKIGVITMIYWAVAFPGDYLVGRQFLPQLKDTTLKEFLEIIPPDLVQEVRIADSIVRVKAVGGKISNVYFRQLEEPDKFRSMNLSGFLIDEANQVSEDAFLLLQGRLRGPGLRRGIIVSNPSGHDWLYHWFYSKDRMKNEHAKSQYALIRAPSTENIHLPEDYLTGPLNSWSQDRISREIDGSFDAFEGMIYEEFRREIHVIKPFRIPDDWPRYVGIDHGLRNPAAWIWCAVGKDGEIYVYREFYQSEWLIGEIINGKKLSGSYDPGVLQMMNYGKEGGDKITQAFIDPSTAARRAANGQSDWDEYVRQLPASFPLYKANNNVTVGIDRVKSYMKIHPRLGRPLLYVFDTCPNLIEEITQYRYKELQPGMAGKATPDEKPVKVDDHAVDALRYVVVSLPEPYQEKNTPKDLAKYGAAERSLMLEIEGMKKPRSKDPFGQGF